MKRKSYFTVCVVSIGLAILGLISDILIRCKLFCAVFFVSENYTSDIFAMIFTVATLSCTLLSIIVSASNNKVLGLELRTIVSLKNSPIQLNEMIATCLIIVVSAIICLAADLCNCITMLAFSLIIYVFYYTASLCKLVFEQEYSKELVRSAAIAAPHINPQYVQRWIAGLFQAIEENDSAIEDEYLSLLHMVVSSDRDVFIQVSRQIPALLAASCKYQSFIESYKKVLRLNVPEEAPFDERTYIFGYIKSLEAYDPIDIYRINLKGTIEDILECKFLSNEEKASCGYWFISAVSKNRNLSNDEKLNILYEGFKRLLGYRMMDSEFTVGVNIAMLAFKNMVLLAKDFEYGKEVFAILLKAIYVSINYDSSASCSKLIAQIARMIYFWAKLETATISKGRRKLIASITTQQVDSSIDNVNVSISVLIEKHHNIIIDYLVQDAFSTGFDFLDYWSDAVSFKNIVVSPESKISFALWFYLVWGNDRMLFPISKYIKTDTDQDRLLSRNVCAAVLNSFSQGGKELSDIAQKGINEIQELFNKSHLIPSGYVFNTYNEINRIIHELNEMQITEAAHITATDVISNLNSLMEESGITIDKALEMDSSTAVQLAPFICYKDNTNISFVTMNLKYTILSMLNQLILKRLPTESFSFDMNGLKKLTRLLEAKQYRYRNYTFYDDWAFDRETRGSAQMGTLKKLVDAIPYKYNTEISEYVFLDVDDIKLNYCVEDIVFDRIDTSSLETHLSIYRTANEQYNIDGGVYSKAEAIEYYHKTRTLLRATIKVETNIVQTSGFHVVFEWPAHN